jgi:hypothetical protein
MTIPGLVWLLSTVIWLPLVSGPPAVKGGIGITVPNCDDQYAMNIGWSFDWGPQPAVCPGLESVPMIWGAVRYGSSLGGNSEYLLAFNEPDRPDQANLTPEQGARDYHDWIVTRYPGRKFVCCNSTRASWLGQMADEYSRLYGEYPPPMEVVGGHIYTSNLADARGVLSEFVALADEWRKPLWISEFAFPPCFVGDNEAALALARQFVLELETQPQVQRYAWFANRVDGTEDWWPATWPMPQCSTSLFDKLSGTPTVWGEWFRQRTTVAA